MKATFFPEINQETDHSRKKFLKESDAHSALSEFQLQTHQFGANSGFETERKGSSVIIPATFHERKDVQRRRLQR
jgi:hypothetical protein